VEIKEILAERQTTYGDYADVAHRSQAIKSAVETSIMILRIDDVISSKKA